MSELFTKQGAVARAKTDTERSDATAELNNTRGDIENFFGELQTDYDTAVAGKCKQGEVGFAKSEMTNFRLMRVTSSFLSNTSACVTTKGPGGGDTVDPKSRCGLRLGQNKGDSNIVTGEYIIGGWCIGTVMDSAASRSSVGNVVRTAPASMAINVNVNVEWWSGDDLHKRYMDVSRTVQQRGQVAPDPGKRATGLDVSLADLEEAVPWNW